jgi:hypothetical protein
MIKNHTTSKINIYGARKFSLHGLFNPLIAKFTNKYQYYSFVNPEIRHISSHVLGEA